jgi:hypothetical protein
MRNVPVPNSRELIKSLQKDLRERVDDIAKAAAAGVAGIVREKYAVIDDRSDGLGPVVPESKSERVEGGAQAVIFIPAGDPKSLKAKKLNALRSPTPFGSTWNKLQSKRAMLDLLKEQGIT